MSTNSIRVDERTKAETVRIAKEMGLSFNAVVNILLRKFNTEKGFPFPVKLEPKRPVSVFDMSSEEFELACREAVSTRDAVPVAEYTTLLDDETGKLMRKYADGRVEYVLDWFRKQHTQAAGFCRPKWVGQKFYHGKAPYCRPICKRRRYQAGETL